VDLNSAVRCACLSITLVFASSLHAQSSPQIAVVNLRLAIASTAEGKQALAEFDNRFAARQKEIDEINRKIDDIAKQFQDKQSTWSDEQKAKAQVEGQRLTRILNRKQAEYQEDRNSAKEDIIQTIGSKLVPIVDRYARENNLGTVMDSSAPGTPLIFVAPTVDITEAVTRLYDQAHPSRSAAAAPAKSAPPAAKPVPTKP